MAEETKAFETFKMAGVQYVAIPNGPNVSIMDEHGGNWGCWWSIENFRKKTDLRKRLGRVKLWFQVLREDAEATPE